jgi:predicted nucleic acid-binding protein
VSVVVVDASVAAKWFLPAASEPLRNEALELLRRYTRADLRLVVPDPFWTETANIFWKAVRQKRLTTKSAESALVALHQWNFPSVASNGLVDLAFVLAVNLNRTVNDALYVALAIDAGGVFVTADEKLANATAAPLPVKWLGSASNLAIP